MFHIYGDNLFTSVKYIGNDSIKISPSFKDHLTCQPFLKAADIRKLHGHFIHVACCMDFFLTKVCMNVFMNEHRWYRICE